MHRPTSKVFGPVGFCLQRSLSTSSASPQRRQQQQQQTLPEIFRGPSAWVGAEVAGREREWVHELSAGEIRELEVAARAFLAKGQGLGLMEASGFSLPSLEQRLRGLKKALLNGLGFALLRGLPVRKYDPLTTAAIFCGVGSHVGQPRPQNAQGHLLGHVRDTGASSSSPTTRIYQTRERQSFHTDSADVVALLCLREAAQGGDSLLVSVEALYNRLRQQSPALLQRLFEPIATDRRGEVPPGALPYMTIPPLSWHEGRLTVFYQRQVKRLFDRQCFSLSCHKDFFISMPTMLLQFL